MSDKADCTLSHASGHLAIVRRYNGFDVSLDNQASNSYDDNPNTPLLRGTSEEDDLMLDIRSQVQNTGICAMF